MCHEIDICLEVQSNLDAIYLNGSGIEPDEDHIIQKKIPTVTDTRCNHANKLFPATVFARDINGVRSHQSDDVVVLVEFFYFVS